MVQVSCAGGLLPALARELGVVEREAAVEGLLFGEVSRETFAEMDDVHEMSRQEKLHIAIHTFLVTGSRLSFYDQLGCVQEDIVSSSASLLAPRRIVGWFIARKGCGVTPSIRAAAVHDSLTKTTSKSNTEASMIPLVHLCVCTTAQTKAETRTIKARAFRPADTPSRHLYPSSLATTSLQVDAAADYRGFRSTHCNLRSFTAIDALSFVAPPSHVADLEGVFADQIASIDRDMMELKELEVQLQRAQIENEVLRKLSQSPLEES